MSDQPQTLSFGAKFLYGFGSIAYGIKDNAFAYFLLFVYVQVFGLAPKMAGLAILIMLIFDAFSDPIIGFISDNTRSKWGRRHPFIYASALPVAVTFFFIWCPPSGLSQTELFWFLLIVGIGIRTAITLYEIPSSALGPELSNDYVERSSLLAYRFWFGWWGGLAMWNMLWTFVVVSSHNGTQDARYLPETWAIYGIASATIMMTAILVTGLGTQKYVGRLHAPKPQKIAPNALFKDIWRTLTISRNYRILFIAMILSSAATGLLTNLTVFFYSFFWELTPVNILTIGLSLFLAPLLSLIAAPALAGNFGKRNTAVGFFSAAMILENTIILLRVADLLPENGTPTIVAIVLVSHWLSVCCVIIATTTVASMVYDTVEEVEEVTGKRMEGTLLAARSFAQKCMSGIGAFTAGAILSAAAWTPNVEAGLISADTLNKVGTYFVFSSVLLWLTALWMILQVDATQNDHEARVAQLASE